MTSSHNVEDSSSAQESINKITLLGAIINALLALLKIVAGWFFGSLSLLADGIHSFSDLITDALVIVGAWLGAKPPDENHPYGHAKFETFATTTIALILISVGLGIGWEAIHSIISHKRSYPSSAILIFASLSIGLKEFLYQATKKVARRISSPILMANAWHHRSDAISSVAVLFGGIGSLWGFGYADHIAGVIVATFIIKVGIDITTENLNQLADAAIEESLLQNIKEIIEGQSGIEGWHRLRTRQAGRQIFMDVHILVDPETTIQEAHAISTQLEEALHRQIANPMNIIIHVEPNLPEMQPTDEISLK